MKVRGSVLQKSAHGLELPQSRETHMRLNKDNGRKSTHLRNIKEAKSIISFMMEMSIAISIYGNSVLLSYLLPIDINTGL